MPWTAIDCTADEFDALASICEDNRRILGARERAAGTAQPYAVEDWPAGSEWAPDEQPGGDCDGPGDGADPTDPWGLAHVEHLRGVPACDDCPVGGRDGDGPRCPRAALCDLACRAEVLLHELPDPDYPQDPPRSEDQERWAAYCWRVLGVEQPGGEPSPETER